MAHEDVLVWIDTFELCGVDCLNNLRSGMKDVVRLSNALFRHVLQCGMCGASKEAEVDSSSRFEN